MASRFGSFIVNPFTRYSGIDLTRSDGLKLVHAKKKQRALEIFGYQTLPLPAGTIREGELADEKAFVETLKQNARARHNFTPHLPNACVLALPERHSFVKVFEVNVPSKADLAEAVRWEASQHIPYEINELTIDWTVLSQDNERYRVRLAAVPQSIANAFVVAAEKAEYTVLGLEPSSLAVLRAAHHQLVTGDDSIAIIQLGEDESFINILSQRQLLLTGALPLKLSELDKMLLERLHLNSAETRRAELLLGFSSTKARGIVKQLLTGPYAQLVARIREILQFYKDRVPDPRPIGTFILTGPGARIHGLTQSLQHDFEINSLTLDQPPGLHLSKKLPSLSGVWLDYTVAVGLVLRTSFP